MGGWYSSTSSTENQRNQAEANYPTKSKTWFDARSSENNNNGNHVVIIPMDMSQHAEGAFECKYDTSVMFWICLCSLLVVVKLSGHCNIYDTRTQIMLLSIGLNFKVYAGAPPPPNGIQFFRFHIHFHRKAPASEVGTPPNGSAPPPPPTGNPGSATAGACFDGVLHSPFPSSLFSHLERVQCQLLSIFTNPGSL